MFSIEEFSTSESKNGGFLKLKLLMQLPKILKAVKSEKKAVSKILESYNISGIISDNRWGVRNSSVPSVFITHQLQVLSGNTTWLSTKIHENIIKKFDMCWIPDSKGAKNFSGKLSYVKPIKIPVRYIGPLSRFKKIKSGILI